MQYSQDDLESANTLLSMADMYLFAIGGQICAGLEVVGDRVIAAAFEKDNMHLLKVAIIGLCFMIAPGRLPEDKRNGLIYAIRAALDAWRPDAYRLMADFLEDLPDDEGSEPSDSVGSWILRTAGLAKRSREHGRLPRLLSEYASVVFRICS